MHWARDYATGMWPTQDAVRWNMHFLIRHDLSQSTVYLLRNTMQLQTFGDFTF